MTASLSEHCFICAGLSYWTLVAQGGCRVCGRGDNGDPLEPPKPMTGLRLAVRLAKGGPLSTDGPDEREALREAVLRQKIRDTRCPQCRRIYTHLKVGETCSAPGCAFVVKVVDAEDPRYWPHPSDDLSDLD